MPSQASAPPCSLQLDGGNVASSNTCWTDAQSTAQLAVVRSAQSESDLGPISFSVTLDDLNPAVSPPLPLSQPEHPGLHIDLLLSLMYLSWNPQKCLPLCRLEARTWVPSPSTWHASTTYHHSCSDQGNQMEAHRSDNASEIYLADAVECPGLYASDMLDRASPILYRIGCNMAPWHRRCERL